MSNRFCNLVGANNIKDEYSKVNAGFDDVEVELDAQAAEIVAIENLGVNAAIGILSMNATGTDTIVATYSGASYFTDLKIALATDGTNTTTTPTFNVNSEGAKSIKIQQPDGTKVDLLAGSMPANAYLRYDGTVFILVNPVITVPLEVDGLGFSIDNGSVRPVLGDGAVDLSYTAGGVYGATGLHSRSDGYDSTASGNYGSRAEGRGTIASGSNGAHAEGQNSEASGNAAHAEGYSSEASGTYSHAEGYNTEANAQSSHAEGANTVASGNNGAHAEGNETLASASYSHSEGYRTAALTAGAHTEGQYNLACQGTLYTITTYSNINKTITLDNVTGLIVGDLLTVKVTNGQSVEDLEITDITALVVTLDTAETITSSWDYAIEKAASPSPTHAEGINTVASGAKSHVEGTNTIASGDSAHSEGNNTVASGTYAHAEGTGTVANGYGSHAEGNGCETTGSYSHAEGYNTEATGGFGSHAEGRSTISSGNYSHAEGYNNEASGYGAHVEGINGLASGSYAHAEGNGGVASGSDSHAGGLSNIAKYMQTAIGQFNTESSASDTIYDATKELFMIGNGTSTAARGNAFKVLGNGSVYADGAYTGTGADYAEYFEWLDSNLLNEDRVGYFVTLDGAKIRKANSLDKYILGVISGTPSVIGDGAEMGWQDKYLTDEWGRIEYIDIKVPAVVDIDGAILEPARVDKIQKQNPNYDPSLAYIPRSKRPEWSAIGMMGKLLVRDDGSCKVNGYCKSNNDGIATASDAGYRVMERISPLIIRVLIK